MGCLRECTSGFAKYILFLFNLIILVAAIILIVMGAKYKSQSTGMDLMSISTFTIIVGVVIGLIAFFGCCGAVKESSCMLTTYAVILITIFIVQLVLGILAFVAIKNGNDELKKEVDKDLDRLYGNYTKNKDFENIIDTMQRNLECCGRNGPSDPDVKNATTGGLISTCCKAEVIQCTVNDAYSDNCSSKLTTFVEKSIKTIGAVAIGFGVLELVAAIFACYVKSTRD